MGFKVLATSVIAALLATRRSAWRSNLSAEWATAVVFAAIAFVVSACSLPIGQIGSIGGPAASPAPKAQADQPAGEPLKFPPRANIPPPPSPFQLSRFQHGLQPRNVIPLVKSTEAQEQSASYSDEHRRCLAALRTYKASLGDEPFGSPSVLREAMLLACAD